MPVLLTENLLIQIIICLSIYLNTAHITVSKKFSLIFLRNNVSQYQ